MVVCVIFCQALWFGPVELPHMSALFFYFSPNLFFISHVFIVAPSRHVELLHDVLTLKI